MKIDFALQRLIVPGSNDPRIKARIGIWHVDAGNAFSLEDFFRNRSGGIESHGHVRSDGELEQYRDTGYEADANYHANPFALSFETQGFEMGIWNDAQLVTIKRTIMWGHKNHGIPLRLPRSWDDAEGGWGYHTLFGAPSNWTPVAKSCPGPRRKEQFHDIIVPWMNDGGDDVTFSPDDEARLKGIEQEVAGLGKTLGEVDTNLDSLVKAFNNYRRNELDRDKHLLKRLKERYGVTQETLAEISHELGIPVE